MRRFLPGSLAGQLVALLLLALVVSQIVAFAVFSVERRSAIGAIGRENALARVEGVALLLSDTPAELHPRILRAVSSRRMRLWSSNESALPSPAADGRNAALAEALRARLGEEAVEVRVRRREGGWRRERRERRRGAWLTVSILRPDGSWLNMTTRRPPDPARWAWPSLLSMLLMALATTAIVVLAVRRMTRPLARLSDAAERLGTGEAVPPLPVEGPPETRRTTEAFNRMNDRLSRFVTDRTRMLAAISHDLRTPITSLRLRAEMIEDEETRARMLDTLEEMQAMTEATLAFAREEATARDTRTVDLAALVEAVCEDFVEMGATVTYAGPETVLYPCRSVAMKRALRNLIGNAVTYGDGAQVMLSRETNEVMIVVEDDGPGIPDGRLEEVFEPFARLETSRARETGGAGLGLAIARSIIRSHGGDIVLANREEGGLRATVALPV